MVNSNLKFVLKSDVALQRYWGLKIDFSGNFDSVFLVSKNSVKFKVKLTRTKNNSIFAKSYFDMFGFFLLSRS